jgi:transcriptional regulator with GAF, ATPase, and Fis domain
MRKPLVLVFAIAVCVYAVGVVLYSQGGTDIGVLCAFGVEVEKVDESQVLVGGTWHGEMPHDGDRLHSIAGRPISSWSDYLQTLASLKNSSVFPRLSLDDGGTAIGRAAREPCVVERGGDEYVRIEFSRAGDAGDAPRRYAWCRLTPPSSSLLAHSLVFFLLKMTLFLIVTVALWKRPQDRALSRFFVLCAVTICAYMGGYHWLRIGTAPPLVLVFMICAVLLPVVCLHFYLTFPRPKRFVDTHPRITLLGLYGPSTLVLAVMLTTYLAVYRATHFGDDHDLVRRLHRVLINVVYVALALAPLLFLGCVVSLGHSFVTTEPGSRERNQVKWILTGAIAATIPIAYALYLAVTETERFGLGGAATPMFAVSLCFTLAYGIAISRYGLMDVDKVLNWGIISIGVSVAAGFVYSLLVFLGTLLIGSQFEPHSPFRQAAWVSITALLLLLVLDLIRWQIRKATDRRLHRERYHLEKTLRRMSEAVQQLVDQPTLCRRLLQALEELLSFQSGAIFVRTGDSPQFRLATHVGVLPSAELPSSAPLVEAFQQSPLVRVRRGPEPQPELAQRQLQSLHGEIALPLRHEGALLAVLLVGPRAQGDYDVEELHLLTTFAQLAALALHGAQGHQTIDGLNQELRTKVEKISEQQRRIVMLQNQLLRQSLPGGPTLTDDPMSEPAAAAASPSQPPVASDIVGSSPIVQQLLHTARKVAASPSAVLIRGESGTGKELLARTLHDNSPRAKGPFVKVHCAALSSNLLESELFGHVKGAFTGAHKDKIGRFELAHGGTLFLDEIGDISLEVQTKLLRVLQEMTFERVGSSEPIQVDVRLVAATHQDLEKLMRQGRFREDLFYRMNVITIRTPPLRERREDIYELALHFLRIYRERSGKRITEIDEETLETLKAYDWPGNIRELENVIERAVVLADGAALTMQELPEELVRAVERRESRVPRNGTDGAEHLVAPEPEWSAQWEERERERLTQALQAAQGNKTRAAKTLGMPRSTFVSKLEKHGLLTVRR